MPDSHAHDLGAGVGDILRRNVDRGAIAGAVALVARGESVHVETAGRQSLGGAAPMRRDSIFRILSMTKPITAAAAMIMVEERLIALDDAVDSWLPELANRRVLRSMESALDDTVPAKRPITLEDLLTLRLGLGAVMAPAGRYPVQTAMQNLGVSPDATLIAFGPDEFMARIGRLPLMHQPGDGWMYHTGMDILGVLIARVTGRPLGEFLHERIFAPLGMLDTGFSVPSGSLDRLPAAYAMEGDRLEEWEPAGGGSYARPPLFPSELVSTTDDYLAFSRMLLAEGRGPHGPLLAAASVRTMMTDHITAEQKAVSPFFPGFWTRQGWGYGGSVTTAAGGVSAPGSYGWMGGLGTSVLIEPVARMTVIVMSQRLMRGPDDAGLHVEVQGCALAQRGA
jgi:CubicO group peptidase (beta-lactamase class C family)